MVKFYFIIFFNAPGTRACRETAEQTGCGRSARGERLGQRNPDLGLNAVLARAVSRGLDKASPAVLSFVQEWRTRQD
jgi:hypothetical protein